MLHLLRWRFLSQKQKQQKIPFSTLSCFSAQHYKSINSWACILCFTHAIILAITLRLQHSSFAFYAHWTKKIIEYLLGLWGITQGWEETQRSHMLGSCGFFNAEAEHLPTIILGCGLLLESSREGLSCLNSGLTSAQGWLSATCRKPPSFPLTLNTSCVKDLHRKNTYMQSTLQDLIFFSNDLQLFLC